MKLFYCVGFDHDGNDRSLFVWERTAKAARVKWLEYCADDGDCDNWEFECFEIPTRKPRVGGVIEWHAKDGVLSHGDRTAFLD